MCPYLSVNFSTLSSRDHSNRSIACCVFTWKESQINQISVVPSTPPLPSPPRPPYSSLGASVGACLYLGLPNQFPRSIERGNVPKRQQRRQPRNRGEQQRQSRQTNSRRYSYDEFKMQLNFSGGLCEQRWRWFGRGRSFVPFGFPSLRCCY